mgnify:CR=1 FL=1|jgi:Putative protein-S-isoprenylcysteine methyltransferase
MTSRMRTTDFPNCAFPVPEIVDSINKEIPPVPSIAGEFAAPNFGRFAQLRKPVSWLVVVVLAGFVCLSGVAGDERWLLGIELFGQAFVALAVIGRIWCAIFISGRKNRELCRDGPYSLCRNPLYGFSFLGLVGLLMAARLFALALLVGGLFWIYHFFVVRNEERQLREIFGKDYSDYCARVPRFWPNFSGYHCPVAVTINVRVLQRALREVVWFLLVLIAFEALEHWKHGLHTVASAAYFLWPI